MKSNQTTTKNSFTPINKDELLPIIREEINEKINSNIGALFFSFSVFLVFSFFYPIF